MRLAVIGDVHGNAPALEAVLRGVRAESPDLVVNLGDQVEGSADPARAAALQHELARAGALEVRGNNEEKFWPGGRRSAPARAYGEWLETQLDAGTRARLAALPLTARTPDGRVLACHGTPDSPWDSLLWVWQADPGGGGFYRARGPRELGALVGPLGAEVVLCGHTHRPGATRVGDTLVVNAGAVGWSPDGDPRARWTLLECRSGRWSVDFRAAGYDVEAAVRWARNHSPFWQEEAALLRSGVFEVRGHGG